MNPLRQPAKFLVNANEMLEIGVYVNDPNPNTPVV